MGKSKKGWADSGQASKPKSWKRKGYDTSLPTRLSATRVKRVRGGQAKGE